MAFFEPLGFNRGGSKPQKKKDDLTIMREQFATEIKTLRKIPHNAKCADCVTNGVPFVVMNFGIFICTNCSGTHRKFGHRVKSIRLDYFKQSEVDILRGAGNSLINAKYLAQYNPKNSKYPLKKSFEWSTPQREQFIHDKYIGKLWYDQYAQPKDAPKKKKKRRKKKKKKKHSSDAPQNALPDDTQFELQQTFMNITNAAANVAKQCLAKNDWDIAQAMDDFYGNLYEDSSDEEEGMVTKSAHVTPGGPPPKPKPNNNNSNQKINSMFNNNNNNGNYNGNYNRSNKQNNNNNNAPVLDDNPNHRYSVVFDQKYDDEDPFGLLSASVPAKSKPAPRYQIHDEKQDMRSHIEPTFLDDLDPVPPPVKASNHMNHGVTPGGPGPVSDFAVQEAQKQIENLQIVIGAQKQLIGKYQAKIKGYELQIDKFTREKASFMDTLKHKDVEMNALKEELKKKQMGNYVLWNSDDVVKWILSADQMFQVYQNKLVQSFRHENIKGSDLSAINENDLHRFGISDFQHKKRLMQLIRMLVQIKQ